MQKTEFDFATTVHVLGDVGLTWTAEKSDTNLRTR